jgi:hypothetical protein
MQQPYRHLTIIALLSFGWATVSNAQHDHGMMHDTTMQMQHPMQMPMSSSLSLSLPMNRNGSGTGWQPDSTPIFGTMHHFGPWMLMAHGDLFLRYNSQNFNNDGKRGNDRQVDAPNWAMLMLQRQAGRNGLFAITGMFSLDRLTMGGEGYPLLFQTGESWNGAPLIDRQHPHDLVSGLSVSYSHRLSPQADVFAYFGYPGEPALGPVAFMHRGSAWGNPDATLGHHWQDATHIVFGVATLGVRLGMFKMEVCSFTGREPNENRYNFDKPRFDSYSYRLSMNPGARWALQFSQGFLKSPEALHLDEDVWRTTASVSQSQPLGMGHYLLSSLLFGMNKTNDDQEPSFGLESALLLDRWSFFARYEYLQKSGEELVLDGEPHHNYSIHALKPGMAFRFASIYKIDLRLGAQATFHFIEEALHPVYGDSPMAAEVFLRFSPQQMRMGGM